MKKGAVIFMFSLLILTSCGYSQQPVQERIRTVKTAIVTPDEELRTVSFPGKVRASSEVNVAFRVAGQLLNTCVNPGDEVKKGELLAELDPRDYQIQFAATEAEYTSLKNDVDRITTLYEKGSVTESEYEKAIYGLKQMEAKYNAHRNALSDTRLYAPFNGYVQKQLYHSAETINAGMPVYSLVSTDSPEVEINIPATNFIERELFKKFTCKIEAYPDSVYDAHLIGITQKANLNQLFTARFRIEGNGVMPSPGMTAMVTITYGTKESDAMVIPVSAISGHNGESYVWKYDKTTSCVSRCNVKLSEIRSNGDIVVVSGLKVDDVVVTAGVNSLVEGQRVKLLEQESKTNIGGVL